MSFSSFYSSSSNLSVSPPLSHGVLKNSIKEHDGTRFSRGRDGTRMLSPWSPASAHRSAFSDQTGHGHSSSSSSQQSAPVKQEVVEDDTLDDNSFAPEFDFDRYPQRKTTQYKNAIAGIKYLLEFLIRSWLVVIVLVVYGPVF
eukprot:GHVT01037155.1.p1 GENE.GHVT01037155.1~~GHVT01037155.1.p1  ORF type:complete len:143 (-),score=14.16 GHVT01037155.1:219-647(-)